nr:transposase (putative), gypsy type [Tanacetum cinerariifolium]
DRSGTLVGQGSAVIVVADADYPMWTLVDPRMACKSENQNDDVEGARNQNDDAGNNVAGDGVADSQGVHVDAGIIRIEDEVPVTVAEKAKVSRKKRKAARGASGSDHPPKKLREDHNTSCDVGASTSGKSLAVIQELFERRCGRTDSATEPHLRTQHPSERSRISDPHIMTTTIATTVAANISYVPVPRAGDELVHASIFANSASVGTDMDSEMLRQIYVPKWNVLNESALDDYDMCCSLLIILLLLCFFPSCAVRMRLEHTLREKKILEGRFNRQSGLLKEMDAEIASLKAQLSLKVAEAAQAIRLRGQIATVEAAEAARVGKLDGLKERNIDLEIIKNIYKKLRKWDKVTGKVEKPSINTDFTGRTITDPTIAASKRSDTGPVCHTRPLDSLKHWNDHFFWADASVFPFVVPWHNNKTLRKDLQPTPDEFDADVCDYLADNPAPFRKFPKLFLCFVGISRYYTLDDNCYTTVGKLDGLKERNVALEG